VIALVMLVVLAACGSTEDPSPQGAESSSTTTSTGRSTTSTTAPPSTTGSAVTEPDAVVGATIRFSRADTHVDVTITADNPTSRDLLSMLPLTLSVEEFNGREKISYLPRDLDTAGSPGHDPADGDLIYYAPWGNLGLYYNTDGIEFSDQVIHLGTYAATADHLAGLEGDDVTVEIIG
jgi:hypothetical protein